MADHVRRQLREAIGTALTGLVTTGSNIFQGRVYALQDAELPALRIYTNSEEVENVLIHSPQLVDRTIELTVQGVAKANADLEDVLDQIAKEVETALAAGVTLGSRSIELLYLGCDITLDGEGEKATGEIEMRYSAQLFNAANTPDTLS